MSSSTTRRLNNLTTSLTSPRKKIILSSLILLASLVALFFLTLQLIARLHYHFGGDAMEAKDYVEAIRHYEKAAQGQSGDNRVFKALGEALHALSAEKPIQEAFSLEKRAMTAFDRAAGLLPIDAEAFYGIARSTDRLEQMHPLLYPGNKHEPFDPLPAYRKAVELRPNGILYRYALARYLYRIGDVTTFHQAIRALVKNSPSTYQQLTEEPFWSEPVEETVLQGLLQAGETGIIARTTNMALAELYERGNQPLEAIHHYMLALEKNPKENQPHHHIHLGSLYLQTAQAERAEQAFLRALVQSKARSNDLQRIFVTYRAHDQAHSFLDFFERADRDYSFSLEARLVVAKALIESQAYFEARHLLKQLNRRRPTAEAHYLLYQIAREQMDLDRMELAIQKATILNPRSSRYHYLFSRVLRRAGKLDDAEKAATLAIDRAEKPSASMLNYRASLRRRLNNLTGALKDWNAALALAPEKAAYHACVADVLVQLGRVDQGLAHAAKAMAFEPENAQYRKMHEQLQGKLKRR